MPDIENLLRKELKKAAEQAQPELLRPLHVPARRSGWRPRLLPLAAAAAVVAVVTAGALVAGHTTAPKGAGPTAPRNLKAATAAVSGPAPAGLPGFYVTTSSGPGGHGIEAVVRSSGTGQITGTLPVSSAIPVEWADSDGTFVTAAADDRSFIIGVQSGGSPTEDGLDLHLFRIAISATGQPSDLTELGATPYSDETTEGIALSPDGKLLAVSMMRSTPGNYAPTIQVFNLATGAVRTWTVPTRNYPYLIGPPSWADGSQEIAVSWLNANQNGLMAAPRGILLLDVTAPGDNLLAGKVIVPNGKVGAGSLVSAQLTPDGRDLVVVTWRDLTPHAGMKGTHTIVVQFAELQASTGKLVRLLLTQTGQYDFDQVVTLEDSLGVLSLESQGQYALVQGTQFGWLDVGGSDPGQFTPLAALPAGQYVNFAAW